MSGRLKGKVAVITGGASGIGEATARMFSAEGAQLVIADMDVVAGEALAAELGEAIFCRTDVMVEDDVAAAILAATQTFGQLDCMINNAGFVGAVGSICDTPYEHWRATLAVMLDGVFLGCKHAALAMRVSSSKGTILNTASVAGLRGGFGAHAYSTAKHAVIGLTRSVASELAPEGVRVNAVAPGAVVTPLIQNLTGADNDTLRKLAEKASPLGQAMYPREIAGAFTYLASDDAAHVTGEVITVDAGVTMAPEVSDFHKADAAFLGPQAALDRISHG
ncbi:MAG: short-chain dehydrogenase [Sphingopyxis sp.]|nr:MAG: short-chain dehydrogenase [Sphingopyxis sp.]